MVIVRSTTRLSHSQGMVELNDRIELEDKPYVRDFAKNVMMPKCKRTSFGVESREAALVKDGCNFPINKVEYNDTKIGFITQVFPINTGSI